MIGGDRERLVVPEVLTSPVELLLGKLLEAVNVIFISKLVHLGVHEELGSRII